MSSSSTTIRPTIELPPAVAVVNPNRPDDLSGLGHLAAVGLTFMTVVAVNRELRRRGFWSDGRGRSRTCSRFSISSRSARSPTWCRCAGLNRAFVAKGLLALRRREHVGATALMDVARLAGPPEPWHLGFLLGPRINAGGRIGRADLGARLLLTDDPIEAGADRRRTRPPQPRAPGDRAGDAWRRPRPRRWPRSAWRKRARSSSPPPKAGIPASSAWSRRG